MVIRFVGGIGLYVYAMCVIRIMRDRGGSETWAFVIGYIWIWIHDMSGTSTYIFAAGAAFACEINLTLCGAQASYDVARADARNRPCRYRVQFNRALRRGPRLLGSTFARKATFFFRSRAAFSLTTACTPMQFLAHRLGLIPLTSQKAWLVFHTPCGFVGFNSRQAWRPPARMRPPHERIACCP